MVRGLDGGRDAFELILVPEIGRGRGSGRGAVVGLLGGGAGEGGGGGSGGGGYEGFSRGVEIDVQVVAIGVEALEIGGGGEDGVAG